MLLAPGLPPPHRAALPNPQQPQAERRPAPRSGCSSPCRTVESLRAEISPVRRKASRFEQQLDVVRQESSAALLRATSEVTLRSQVGMPLYRPLDSA